LLSPPVRSPAHWPAPRPAGSLLPLPPLLHPPLTRLPAFRLAGPRSPARSPARRLSRPPPRSTTRLPSLPPAGPVPRPPTRSPTRRFALVTGFGSARSINIYGIFRYLGNLVISKAYTSQIYFAAERWSAVGRDFNDRDIED
jgi:hypothetical protein